jgi:hypothetical protein
MHLDSFSIISIREYHVDQSPKTSAERTGQFFRPQKQGTVVLTWEGMDKKKETMKSKEKHAIKSESKP